MKKEDLIAKVEKSLDKIRPFLIKDGGNVKIIDLSELGELSLEFMGNCSTCSMSGSTFQNGIRENVINDVPQIKKITVTNLSEELI